MSDVSRVPLWPQPTEKAGRKGHLFEDGSILWDDGEREYPTSGLSDEQKRAQARADAEGMTAQPTKPGVTNKQIEDARALVRRASDPEATLAERKAAAKKAAGSKPGSPPPALPPSQGSLEADARRAARRLLELEIDRCEEIKAMAVNGQVGLARAGVPITRGNPPLVLHEQILTAIRVLQSGKPSELVELAAGLRAWQASDLYAPAVSAVNEAQRQASDDKKGGGKSDIVMLPEEEKPGQGPPA